MTMRHLKLFIQVADEESITKAAEKLFISQPTVSIAIKEIEEHYGICLFERINQRLKITLDGKKFYTYASQIVLLFDDLDNTFSNPDLLGDLRLGASLTFGIHKMPALVSQFSKLFPSINVHVQIDASDVIERKILTNDLDLAVIEGIIHSPHIVSKEIFRDELIAVCAPNYPLAGHKKISLEVFSNERFLLRERTSGFYELFTNAMSLKGYCVKSAWESTSIEALLQAAKHGLGIAIVPEILVEQELNTGQLVMLQVANFKVERTIRLIHHKNKFISQTMKHMIQMLEGSDGL